MKHANKRLGLISAVALVVALLPAPALAADGGNGDFAVPVEYTLFVDGKNISTWAYDIEDGVYFNLRDLAMALNGTDKQFGVGWDGAENAVSLTPGAAYTPVGREFAEPAGIPAGTVAYMPPTVFYIGKRQIPMRTYIVSGSHYAELADLAANLMFACGRDDERHLVKIGTDAYYTGIYSFSLPEGFRIDGSADCLEFTRSGDTVGSLCALTYEKGAPISMFEGNHAQTLSSGALSGFDYPAAKAIIRRTQPAAAQDDSYVDELHIYILLSDYECAYDFCFDSEKVSEATAMEIASGFTPNEPALRIYGAASQWARAVQDRDGHAQYALLVTKLQSGFYDRYESANWITGMSSPRVSSFTVEISGNQAVVFYKGVTRAGFAGYAIDTLSFSEEDGQLRISGIGGHGNLPAFSTAIGDSAALPESRVLLASLTDDHISIYGDKTSLNKYGDLYEGLYLSIGGVSKYFQWENTVGAFDPELALADLNGDGKMELVIILTTASGTGVHLSDIHVIDPRSFSETCVTDPLEIIGKNVSSSVVFENETVTITMTVSGKRSAVTFGVDYARGWVRDRAVFGNIIRYSVQGANLKATVPVQVSNSVFIGDVDITYAFDGYYDMGSVDYVPYDFTRDGKGFTYSPRVEALKEFSEAPISDLLAKGKTVSFSVASENKDWVRPSCSDEWSDPSYTERFPGPFLQVDSALHRLFEMPVGASASFPFYVDLGLDGENLNAIFGPEDYFDHVALLLINARVKNVVTLDNQTAITAEPARTGYQVLLLDRGDLMKDKMLFQLVTPDGYEIDYLPSLLQ